MNFIDSLASIIFSARLSANGEIVFEYCNQRIDHYLSITPPELMRDANLLFNCIAEKDRDNIKNSLQSAIKDQQEFHCEFEIVTALSSSTWMLLHITPSGNTHSGNSVGGVITDITDSHATRISAIEAANHFLHLQDQLPDRFYFKDRNSIFRGGNKSWYRFHGFASLADAIGKSDFNSGVFTQEAAQDIFEQEQEMMRSGTPIHRCERHVFANGTSIYADSKKVPLYNDNNEVIGLVGLTRDITEIVKTEQALEKAKQEAEQAAKAKSSFLAVMSHEIRTPMNGVIGCASLLGSTPLTTEQEQLVRTIQSSGESLLVLINDILDYSKIEAGKINLESSPFQLQLLIEDCIELFSKQVADKQLKINYFIEADVPLTLNGDATRIRQIINNLVGNAIKFTDQGEVFIDVSLTTFDSAKKRCGLFIAIKDTGIGISDENQSNLFNAFTQADSSITRKFGGTGLGLVICKKIVEQMEGDIWFKSVLGEGTTFYLTLPLNFEVENTHTSQAVDRADKNNAKKLMETKAHESLINKDTRILVVEDNTVNQMVIAMMLKKLGYTNFSCVADGEEAVAQSKTIDIDIIFMDIQMLRMDGYTAAKLIRQQTQHPTKPWIIALTAGAQKEDNERAFAAGMNAFTTKPIQLEGLKAVLANAENSLSREA